MSKINYSALKLVIKHFFIMMGVCLIVSLVLYISSLNQSIKLHQNAYRDITRSIIIMYILFFVGSIITKYLLNRYIIGESKQDEKFNIKEYFDRVTPYETIGISFTLLTIINSIMMVTGVDTPKEGVFAYVHLMMRLSIITLIVVLISFRDIKTSLNEFKMENISLSNILYAPRKDSIISISKAYTNISILYCLTMISLQRKFTSLGGINFYLSLLVLWLIISILRIITSGFKEHK
ncbi:hypothetical protein [Acetoanaerobium pronyense]|nr:hypothetical protein [Acetoanaerobium pronyense]